MKHLRIHRSLLFVLLFSVFPLTAQEHFNVSLRLDFASVDALLEFSEGRIANVNRVASLRGNQIAAATSALLAREAYSKERFAQELERFRNGATASRDMFGLTSAMRFRNEIRTLSQEAKKRALERRVMATIAPFFPEKIRLNATIPVYFVAMGNENAAAFVRSIVWRDDVPYFVGEGEGELTIVMNLTRSVEYIRDVQVQFIDMMSTLAHESFHVVFGLYQQQQPVWQQIAARPEPHWVLAELVQNEGIAYLISLQQRNGAQLSSGQLSSSKQSVADLNKALSELASPNLTRERARELIMNSNLSGSYEKNYGASAGVLMAYAIDAKLGRAALTQTLELGTADFFAKYQQLASQHGELPKFDDAVMLLFQ